MVKSLISRHLKGGGLLIRGLHSQVFLAGLRACLSASVLYPLLGVLFLQEINPKP